MSGSLLGPAYEAADVASVVAAEAWAHRRISDRDELAEVVARRLADGAIVGLFDGRMEFGPRALGSRSILADPRGEQTQRTLNLKIKHRESFRPFAPAVLAEHAGDWFEMDGESPYMTFVVPVRGVSIDADPSRPGSAGREPGAAERPVDLSAALTAVTSPLPAVTHVDGSARVQTVSADRPTMLRRILEAFDRRTDCPVLVNTSFNVRGEPIVCSPHDAYRTFMTTEIDLLVLEDCLLEKSEQPPWRGGDRVFDLD